MLDEVKRAFAEQYFRLSHEERRLQSILTPVIEDKDRLEKEMGETVRERLSLMRRYEDLFGERMSSVLREYGKQEKPGFTHDQIVERIKQQLALHLGDAPYGCLDCYHGKPCIDKLILQLALDRVNRDQEE